MKKNINLAKSTRKVRKKRGKIRIKNRETSNNHRLLYLVLFGIFLLMLSSITTTYVKDGTITGNVIVELGDVLQETLGNQDTQQPSQVGLQDIEVEQSATDSQQIGLQEITEFGISNIGSCQTINTPGSYTLDNDVSSTTTCFNITAEDVTFDCNGFTITYGTYATSGPDLPSNGFFVNRTGDVIIKNCIIQDTNRSGSYGHGIYFYNASNSTVLNTVILTNGTNNSHGIAIDNGTNITVVESIITTTGAESYAIWLNSSNNNFMNNTLLNPTAWIINNQDTLNNFTNTTFETDKGSIIFPQHFNISVELNLTQEKLNFSANRAFLNSTALPFLNTTAQVLFKNVRFQDPYLQVDFNNDEYFDNCTSPQCDSVYYNHDVLKYNISSFSSYRSMGRLQFYTDVIATDIETNWQNSIKITAPDENNVYVAYSDNYNLTFLKSNDGGSTWSQKQIIDNVVYRDLSIDAPSKNIIYITYQDGWNGDLKLANSSDGGDTWTIQSIDSKGDVGYFPAIAAPTDDIIYIFYGDSSNSTLKFAKSTDGGVSWDFTSIDPRLMFTVTMWTDIVTPNETTIYAAYTARTLSDNRSALFTKSTDGGATWQPATLLEGYLYVSHDKPAIAAPNLDKIYISYSLDYHTMINSTDKGNTWSTIRRLEGSGTLAAPSLNALYTSYYNTNTLRFRASYDGGSKWHNQTIDSNGNVGYYPALAAPDEDTVFIAHYDSSNNTLKFATTSNITRTVITTPVEGDESNVTTSGITSLNVTVNGQDNLTSVTGVASLEFSDGIELLVNLSHNFSKSMIDLSKVTITKSSNGLLINLSGQLASGETKTMYLTDNGYTDVCVEDAEIASLEEISTTCSQPGETKFTRAQCIASTTIGNITCSLAGGSFVLAGLTHSGAKENNPLVNVSTCGDIDAPNIYYRMNQSVYSNTTCFNISASDLTLDCAGYTIYYDVAGSSNTTNISNAIYAREVQNISIRNCIIEDPNKLGEYAYAINVNRIGNSSIYNNTINTNGTRGNYGIYTYQNTNNTEIRDNIINARGNWSNNVGIQLYGPNNIVAGNTITTNGTDNNLGMAINSGSFNVLIANNTIYTGGSSYQNLGISVSSGNGHTVMNNNISTSGGGGNNYGIYINTNYVTAKGNQIITNGSSGSSGINVRGAYHNIRDNNITTHTEFSFAHGIWLDSGNNNSFTNNTITPAGNAGYSIFIYDMNHSNFRDNILISPNGWIWTYPGTFNNFTGTVFESNNSRIKITDLVRINDSQNISRAHNLKIENNLAFINSTNISFMNKSAKITLTNLPYFPEPTVDYQDDGTFEDCNEPQCTIDTRSPGSIVFDVASFTSYSTQEAPNLVDTCGTVNTSIILNQSISSAGTCLTVTEGNITIDCNGYTIKYGTTVVSGVYGITLGGSSGVTVKNCFIEDGSFNGQDSHGIIMGSNNTITHNTIQTNGTLNNNGIYINQGINNQIVNNKINTTGSSSTNNGIGISLATGTNNISRNNISTHGAGGYSYGIYLENSNSQTISNNNISTIGNANGDHGIFIIGTGQENNISHNTISTRGTLSSAIHIQADSNRITYNNVSGYHGISLQSSADYNNITNNTIVSVPMPGNGITLTSSNYNRLTNNAFISTGSNDVQISSSTDTRLIDSLGKTSSYSLSSSNVIIEEDLGKIQFATIDGSGSNLTDAISIENHTVYVDSVTSPHFNISADITLYNSYSEPTIIADYQDDGSFIDCPNTTCTVKSNTGTEVVFNVTHFTSYRVLDKQNLTSCQTLDTGYYTLNSTLVSKGTCIIMSSPYTTLDCKGHKIIYGTDQGTLRHGLYANYTQGLTIKNCIFEDNTTGGDTGYGIRFYNVSNTDIINNTIETNDSTTTFGIQIAGITRNILVSNNRINSSSGGIAKGITGNANNSIFENNSINTAGGVNNHCFQIGSGHNNILRHNKMTCTGSTSYGIYFTNANNNTIDNDTITFSSNSQIRLETSNNAKIIDTAFYNFFFDTSSFELVKTGKGSVKYTDPITESGSQFHQDFIIDNNSVYIDSINEPGFNHSAQITLFNLPFTNPAPIVDLQDDSTFEECNEPQCYIISSSPGQITYNVSSFTNYSSQESPNPIGSCGDINESGQLNQSVTATATCFNITADNVTLDCLGYNITFDTAGTSTGGSPAVGVFASGRKNIQIKNCNLYDNSVAGYTYGINLDDVNSSVIMNNIVYNKTGKSERGMLLYRVYNSQINNNSADSNNIMGIASISSSNNSYSGNTANFNTQIGISFSSSSNDNVIISNTANNNLQQGIYLSSSCNNNNISGNNASFNEYGIYLSISNNYNIITDNTANNNLQQGMYIQSSSNNTVFNNNIGFNSWGLYILNSDSNNCTSNIIKNNTNQGVLLQGSNNNIIFNNNASFNQHGLYITSSSNDNNIYANNAISNTQRGIHIDDSDNNTIFSNNMSFNKQHGIYMESSSNNNISSNNVINNSQHGMNFISSNNNTISNNTIVNNSWTGMFITSSINNTISGNTIHKQKNAGLYLTTGCDYNTISGNDVAFNSQSGIWIRINSNNNRILNNSVHQNIQTGIDLHSSSNNTISDNIVKNCSSSGMQLASSSINNTISGNTLVNNTFYGIWLTSSLYNTVSNNNVTLNERDGMYLNSQSNNNTISGNNMSDNIDSGINLYTCNGNMISGNIFNNNSDEGVRLEFTSTGNTITDNTINHNDGGISILFGSYNNTFSNNNANLNGGTGIFISNSNNNSLINNNIVDEVLRITTSNRTRLVTSLNSTLNYDITSSDLSVEEEFGSVLFLQPFTEIGNQLNHTIKIGNNSVYVNSINKPGINVSARITLNDINRTRPIPTVDFQDDGTFENCKEPQCTIVTRSPGYIVFDVASFTNYSTTEGPNIISQCGNINQSGILNQSVTATGTCFNITADNVVLDCNGYSIFYDSSGTSTLSNPSNGIFADHQKNIAIKNCVIKDINSGGNEGYGIYFKNASNSTISNNEIYTNGTQENYGIFLLDDSNHNSILNNKIQTFGTDRGNSGIRLQGDCMFNNVSRNNFTTYGTMTNHGIHDDHSGNNTITYNNISASGTQNSNNGIILEKANNNIIIGNMVSTSGSFANAGIYLTNDLKNVTVSDNTVLTTGTYENFGIHLETSENSTVRYNNIKTNCSGNDNYGMYIMSQSHYNSIIQNNVSTNGTISNYGIYLNSNADHNNVSYNIVNANGTGGDSRGLTLQSGADNNTFIKNTLIAPGSNGIYVFTTSHNNTFVNNTVLEANTDFRVDNSLSTKLVDSMKQYYSYQLSSANLIIQEGNSELRFIETMSTFDTNLSRAVSINSTHAFVWTALDPDFNTSAEIKQPGPYIAPKIKVDEQDNGTYLDCPEERCTILQTTPNIIYNVTQWSTYKVKETLEYVDTCRYLNQSDRTYRLNTTISANTTCFNITADFVTLDCNGYNIYYDIAGTSSSILPSNGVYANNIKNLAVKNCNITDVNSSGSSGVGISLHETNDSLIVNNSIYTNGLSSNYGILLMTSCQNNGLMNNTIVTGNLSGNNQGIYVWLNSVDTLITGNDITTNGASGNNHGIKLEGGANNNTIQDNTIRTNDTVSGNNRGVFITSFSTGNMIHSNTIITGGNTDNNHGIEIALSSNNTVAVNNSITTGGQTGSDNNYGIRVYLRVHDNMIANNTIITTGANDNYGITLLQNTTNNTILGNTIQTSGTSDNNIGIRVQDSSNNTIEDNLVKTTGGVANYGIYLFTSTSENNITNNNITTNGTNFNYGLSVSSSTKNSIQYNIINANGTGNSNIGIFTNTATENNITSNTIRTNGTSTNYGIYLFNNADTNLIDKNTIDTFGSSTKNIGILLWTAPSENTISNNNITTNGTSENIGLFLGSTANYNRVNNNIMTATGTSNLNYGIAFNISSNNNLTGNNITTSGTDSHGLYLDYYCENNNITSTQITSSSYGIYIKASNNSYLGNTELINNVQWIISDGSVNNLSRTQITEPLGSIQFTPTIQLTSINVTRSNIVIGNNSAFVNSTALPALNTTARVTFTGINRTFPTPTVDYQDDGTFINCTEPQCTIINRGTGFITFDVASFTNYSTTEGTTPIYQCGEINESGTLNQSVTATGTCFTIIADDVTLDCQGYTITYDTDGLTDSGSIYNAVYAFNRDNIQVKNCIIQDGNSAGNSGYGIYFNTVTDSFISNNNIETNGTTNDRGIQLTTSSNITVQHNTVSPHSSLNGPAAIYLQTFSENNTITNNTITVESIGQGVGITLGWSDHNEIFENRIESGASGGGQNYGFEIQSSVENNIHDNWINTTGAINSYAVLILSGGDRNNITRNNITANGTNSRGIWIANGFNNSLTNNSIDSDAYSLYISSANGTKIIKSIKRFESYNLLGSDLEIQETFGTLKFTKITGSGKNLSNDINISSNQIFVNSTNATHFNTSAEITLKNLNHQYVKPIVDYQDDGTFEDCPETRCKKLSYTGGTFTFNVSSFTTYSSDKKSVCGVLNESITLTNDVNSSGTCFMANTSNVILDCHGHTIDYSEGVAGTGINITGATNVTVRNCTINDVSSQAQSAVWIQSASSNTIENCTIITTATSAAPVYMIKNSNNNIVNRSILKSGGPNAITMVTSTSSNTVAESQISSSSSHGVSISNSASNNIVERNNITSGSAGVNIVISSLNTIIRDNNISAGNEGVGIFLSSTGTQVLNNNISGSTGIRVQTLSNTITRNTVKGAATSMSFSNNAQSNAVSYNRFEAPFHLIINTMPSNTFSHNIFSNATTYWQISSGTGNTITNTTIRSPHGDVRFIPTITLGTSSSMTENNFYMTPSTVFLNSTQLTYMNTSAEITMNNIFQLKPIVQVDYNDDSIFETCEQPKCYNLSYNANTYIFNVSGFTTYRIYDNGTSPQLTPITITPDPAYTTDDVSANTTYTDPQGADGTVFFNWTVDGTTARSVNYTAPNGTLISDTLTSANFNKNQNVTAIAIAEDNETLKSPEVTDSITISNTLPTTPTITLTPLPADITQNLTCTITANSTDADNDQVNYTIEWYNGTNIMKTTGPAAIKSDLLQSGNTSLGDTWNCTVTPFDGEANGTSTTQSSNIIPETTPPTSTINNPNNFQAIGANNIPYEINGTADDNHILSYINLSINNTIVTAAGTAAWSYSWTPAGGQYQIFSIATDVSENQETALEIITISAFPTSTLYNSFAKASSIENSVVASSTINDSNASQANINTSLIDPSTIINSNTTGSNITDCVVNNSDMNTSICAGSTVDNSTVINSTLQTGTTVQDATITDGQCISGTIIYQGTTTTCPESLATVYAPPVVTPTPTTTPTTGGGGGGSSFCRPRYECTDWTECTNEGTQARTCTDTIGCSAKFRAHLIINVTKPEESQACIPPVVEEDIEEETVKEDKEEQEELVPPIEKEPKPVKELPIKLILMIALAIILLSTSGVVVYKYHSQIGSGIRTAGSGIKQALTPKKKEIPMPKDILMQKNLLTQQIKLANLYISRGDLTNAHRTYYKIYKLYYDLKKPEEYHKQIIEIYQSLGKLR